MVEVLRRHRSTLFVDALAQAKAGAEAFRMAGVVRRRQERTAQSGGGKFAFVTLSDPTGEYEVLFPPETLRRCRDLLEPGRAVLLKVRAKTADGEVRFFGDDASPLDKAIAEVAAGLRIYLSPTTSEFDSLKKRLRPSDGGGGEVMLVAALGGGREVEVRLPGRYQLDLSIRGALKTAPGVAFLEDV
jgi:DNA polymerase-3 subunit alpha